MSNADIQILREDIKEVKEAVKELTQAFNDFRVLVSDNYVKKEEFNEHIKIENSNKWKLATITVAISAVIVSVVQFMFNLFKGSGQN